MPVELQVIRAREFVCLDANEHLDFHASKLALRGLAEACQKRGLGRAVLDLRGLPILPQPHFNTEQVDALVGAFRSAGFDQKHRLAILYDHDVYGIIRNFIMLSRIRGLQVKAFTEYEKAVSWLSGKIEDTSEWRRASHVSIAKSRAKKSPAKATGTKTSRITGGKTKLRPVTRLVSKRRRS